MSALGGFAVPVVIGLILLGGLIRRVPVFDAFLEGAGEGIKTMTAILPSLVGLITAVEMFQASGAMDMLTEALKPAAGLIALPPETMPLAILRPISGGGAFALFDNLLKNFGPDSAAGRVGSVLCGSSETTFYTVTVYYGACGVSKTRYTIFCALLADFIAVIASSLAVKMLF
ncbi:MAG TPA: spore maturation protein [Ruminococcaceae bacterium]|nr:spore maturation protein [Oscillospiraceae bacterium]